MNGRGDEGTTVGSLRFSEERLLRPRAFFAPVLGLLLGIAAHGQTLIVDPAFAPMVANGGSVATLLIQPDGKIVIAGAFAGVNGQTRGNVARLNPDGTLDPAFDPALRVDGPVSSLALQPDGAIVLGGSFGHVDGMVRTNLARLNRDGSLDTSFAVGTNGVNGPVQALAIQGDGKIIIGGSFDFVNGTSRPGIARLNSDGSFDAAFNPLSKISATGHPGGVYALAVQNDGKILAGGDFYLSVNNLTHTNIARLNSDGTVDTNFNANVGVVFLATEINALALQGDGRILVGGRFDILDGVQRNGLGRLNADGSLDYTFNANTNAWARTLEIRTLALQTNGALFGGGYFGGIDPPGPTYSLVRFSADGSTDTSFAAVSLLYVQASLLQDDGSLVIGGSFTTVNGLPRSGLARFIPAMGVSEPDIIRIGLHPDGSVSLTVTNLVVGSTYRVDTSAALASWTLLTNFVAQAPSSTILDSTAAGTPRRYYRLVVP